MEILLTGAYGMLGKYIRETFPEDEITTLGKSGRNDIVCDIRKEIPSIPERSRPELVIHAAGTESPEDAFPLNLDGTKNLLAALESRLPRNFVYISSWQVYSPSAGENVDETAYTWASGDAGKSKVQAEQAVREWCDRRGVNLTILRPSTMFGSGMKGWADRMFKDVVTNRYVHIRGNDARLSVVMALDVARAVRRLYHKGGLYNVNDGKQPTYLELAEAMSANSGAMKRVTHLPEKWADALYDFGKWIPWVKIALNPETLKRRSETLTLSSTKAIGEGCEFFHVTSVLAHEETEYPYQDS